MSDQTVPVPPKTEAQLQAERAARTAKRQRLLLVVALLVASSLVVAGVADWNASVAKIVAGLLVAALGVLFLFEANG